VDVVGHNAEGPEAKVIFLQGLFVSLEQHLGTLSLMKFKFRVIATHGDVVAVGGLEIAAGAGHKSEGRACQVSKGRGISGKKSVSGIKSFKKEKKPPSP
jgi:hypothetical protein